MSYRKNAARLLAGSALALAFTAPAAFAADTNAVELETLIVTASKRAENIQDVPMSVSAVSGDYIEKAGVTNATDLARFIPSVAVTQSNNNRNTTLYVRGIGTRTTAVITWLSLLFMVSFWTWYLTGGREVIAGWFATPAEPY